MRKPFVREAPVGAVTRIDRRSELAAELRPASSPLRMPAEMKARIFASMEEVWARTPHFGDSARLVDEDRDR